MMGININYFPTFPKKKLRNKENLRNERDNGRVKTLEIDAPIGRKPERQQEEFSK